MARPVGLAINPLPLLLDSRGHPIETHGQLEQLLAEWYFPVTGKAEVPVKAATAEPLQAVARNRIGAGWVRFTIARLRLYPRPRAAPQAADAAVVDALLVHPVDDVRGMLHLPGDPGVDKL
jgi:hypothetical protein